MREWIKSEQKMTNLDLRHENTYFQDENQITPEVVGDEVAPTFSNQKLSKSFSENRILMPRKRSIFKKRGNITFLRATLDPKRDEVLKDRSMSTLVKDNSPASIYQTIEKEVQKPIFSRNASIHDLRKASSLALFDESIIKYRKTRNAHLSHIRSFDQFPKKLKNYQSSLESKDHGKCLINKAEYDLFLHNKFIQKLEGNYERRKRMNILDYKHEQLASYQKIRRIFSTNNFEVGIEGQTS